MDFILQPWHLYLVIVAGWVNRQQQELIDFLITENRVLKEKLGSKRIPLTDDQRRRLAVKGRALGRKRLQEVGTLFAPDTILRWHRELVANKWDYSDRRKSVGRPRIRQEIVSLILRFATENPSWGYDRIQGAVANVGYRIADSTVANILKAHGIEPAPNRGSLTKWATFRKAHWDVIASIDFTTVEVWTKGGLVTYYLLFVMELKTRRVYLAGCTHSPNEAVMKQIARQLTDAEDGFLNGNRYLIKVRDTKFCDSFRSALKREGVKSVVLPPRSPNLNSHLEIFFGSLKRECLSKMIFFGQRCLTNAVNQYLDHYHTERNHQGLENSLIEAGEEIGSQLGDIDCRERFGGTLKYYHRNAA